MRVASRKVEIQCQLESYARHVLKLKTMRSCINTTAPQPIPRFDRSQISKGHNSAGNRSSSIENKTSEDPEVSPPPKAKPLSEIPNPLQQRATQDTTTIFVYDKLPSEPHDSAKDIWIRKKLDERAARLNSRNRKRMEPRAPHTAESATQPDNGLPGPMPEDECDLARASEGRSEMPRVSIPNGCAHPSESGPPDKKNSESQTNFSGTIRITPGMNCSLRKRKKPRVLACLAESERYNGVQFVGESPLKNRLQPGGS
jgi:hypothetical protein